MNALSINAETKQVEAIEIEMQANTIYSFFGSILIDEHESLNEHKIFSDANSLSEKKDAYFIGEQLVLGNALIVGKFEFSDVDVTIKQEELQELINPELNQFYIDVLELLSNTDINLYRTFEVTKGAETISLNTEWVIYTFNIADIKTQEYFIAELNKWLEAKKSAESYMQKMANLAFLSAGK